MFRRRGNLSRQGQGDGKDGALAYLALQLQAAAVEADDVLDNGKTQACAAIFAGPALIHPVEALEHTGLGLLRDADARVGYGNHRLAARGS